MQRMMLAVLLPALAAGAGTAQAQSRRADMFTGPAADAPTGLMLNAHSVAALGTTVRSSTGVGQRFATGLGAGGGVQVGYAFTPRITAYVGLQVAKQGSQTVGLDGHMGLSHIEVGGRLSFPISDSRIRPYAMVSVARRGLGTTIVDQLTGESVKLRFSGMSVGGGGGIQYFMSPSLAVDGAVSVGFGKFGNLKVDENRLDLQTANSTTARLMAGMSWYPSY